MAELEEYFEERLRGIKERSKRIVDDMKSCRLRFVVDELPAFMRRQNKFVGEVSKAEVEGLISKERADDLIMDAVRAKWDIDAAGVNMWLYCKCRRE